MDRSSLLAIGVIGIGILLLVSSFNWRRSIKSVFVLVLVEGAIRKWILPSASDLVYFAKDVVLAGAYLGVVFKGGFSIRSSFPQLPWPVFQLCWAVILLEAMNPNTGSIFEAILGLRGYLLYLPIIFLMPRLFRSKKEFVDQIAVYTLMSIPVCVLGVLQFSSDRFSVINKYAAGMEDYGAAGFGLGENDYARITGTFSYLSGHSTFVCVFFALNIAILFFDRLPYRFFLSFVSLPLLVGNALMGGSRAAVYAQGATLLGFVCYAAITQVKAFRKRSTALLIIAAICVLASVTLFSKALSATQSRIGDKDDGLAHRLIHLPLDNMSLAWSRGGLFGCGIGSTAPTIYGLRQRLGLRAPLYDPGIYDFEPASILAEIGFIGVVVWYVFRLILVMALARNSLRQKDPGFKALSLAALFISLPFFCMSLVTNHVACVLLWGICGLGLPLRMVPESKEQLPTVRTNGPNRTQYGRGRSLRVPRE